MSGEQDVSVTQVIGRMDDAVDAARQAVERTASRQVPALVPASEKVAAPVLLVLDDDHDHQMLIAETARQVGYEPVIVTTVAETVRLVQSARHHIERAVIDWKLAGGRATMAAAMLQELPIPLAVMTGYPEDEELRSVRERGAVIITKPDFGKLRAWLEDAIGRHQK